MTFSGGHQVKKGTAIAVLVALSGAAQAQDTGGLSANLSFSQGLTYSDVDGTYGRTDLGFDLESETRSQSFALSVNSGFEQRVGGDAGFTVVDPSVAMSYGIENRQTAFSANVSYSEADADSFVEFGDGIDAILVLDEGTREDRAIDLGLNFGREALVGGTLSLGYSEVLYTDTTSTDLINSDNLTAGLNLRFEIDRRLTATLGYELSETDRDGGRDLTEQSLSIGAETAITQTLSADASIGVSRFTVEDGGVTTENEGLIYDFSITQERPNGELSFSLSSDLSESGRRTTAMVNGSFETRQATFTAGLGLSDTDTTDFRPIVELRYGHELPRGSYSISLNQSFNNTADGDQTLVSQLKLNWEQDLTRSSRLSSDLTYQISDVLGASDDTSRLELGVSYSHDLTEDWTFTTRLSHQFDQGDAIADERENEIFVGLETSFGWRP